MRARSSTIRTRTWALSLWCFSTSSNTNSCGSTSLKCFKLSCCRWTNVVLQRRSLVWVLALNRNLCFCVHVFSSSHKHITTFTIVPEALRSVLVDVGDLIQAQEHGVVRTPLAVRLTACGEKWFTIKTIIAVAARGQTIETYYSRHRVRMDTQDSICSVLICLEACGLAGQSHVTGRDSSIDERQNHLSDSYRHKCTDTQRSADVSHTAQDRWYVGNPLSFKTSADRSAPHLHEFCESMDERADVSLTSFSLSQILWDSFKLLFVPL